MSPLGTETIHSFKINVLSSHPRMCQELCRAPGDTSENTRSLSSGSLVQRGWQTGKVTECGVTNSNGNVDKGDSGKCPGRPGELRVDNLAVFSRAS
jgi:hypothetical protein